MDNLSFNVVMDVTFSWDSVKSMPNYADVAGEMILTEVLKLHPKAKDLFHFQAGSNGDVRADPRFMMHARRVVDMFDCAVTFLGPDVSPLVEDLIEMGKRHKQYGVPIELLPLMGRAFLSTLEKLLGKEKFSAAEQKSWNEVIDFMNANMAIGMK